ncbi:MAG: sel1 repeat family protein [Elusimicrobiaceae bacterium]|nr:sel1 repeat family protein [Elusimicrobiaceae bacterium]
MKTFLKILIGLLLAGGLFTFAFYRTPQERAFTKNLKLAQAGDMDAAIQVAQAYLNGAGTKPNPEQALTWYQQAAAADKPQAAWELYQYYDKQGVFEQQEEDDYEEPRPVMDPFDDPFGPRQGYPMAEPQPMRQTSRRNLTEEKELALAYLQSAAQADFAPAQYELGNLYAQGSKGFPQHKGQSLFWYMKAAQNGSNPAQAKVTALTTEDPALYAQTEQFMQTLTMAQQNDPQAMFQLAQAYRQGIPVLRDDAVAAEWFKKAWDKSDKTLSQAAFELADQYYKGEGVEQNSDTATELLAQAAQLKNPYAQYLLGEYAYTDDPARLEDAFAWFSNAAAQGHAKAQYMTGFMLLQGQGTAKSVPLAIRFFEQAAQQNDASAQYVLGQIYLKGLGVKRSPRQGRVWLERAVENGSEPAKEMLGM